MQTNPFVQSVQILICQEIFTEAVKIINRDGFCNDLGEKVTINHGFNRGEKKEKSLSSPSCRRPSCPPTRRCVVRLSLPTVALLSTTSPAASHRIRPRPAAYPPRTRRIRHRRRRIWPCHTSARGSRRPREGRSHRPRLRDRDREGRYARGEGGVDALGEGGRARWVESEGEK